MAIKACVNEILCCYTLQAQEEILPYPLPSVIWQECRDPNVEETVLGSSDLFRFYISILKIHKQRHENLLLVGGFMCFFLRMA